MDKASNALFRKLERDIATAKIRLINKAKTNFCENFGEDEIRKIEDKYNNLEYSCYYARYCTLIIGFKDWCYNYSPYQSEVI